MCLEIYDRLFMYTGTKKGLLNILLAGSLYYFMNKWRKVTNVLVCCNCRLNSDLCKQVEKKFGESAAVIRKKCIMIKSPYI